MWLVACEFTRPPFWNATVLYFFYIGIARLIQFQNSRFSDLFYILNLLSYESLSIMWIAGLSWHILTKYCINILHASYQCANMVCLYFILPPLWKWYLQRGMIFVRKLRSKVSDPDLILTSDPDFFEQPDANIKLLWNL